MALEGSQMHLIFPMKFLAGGVSCGVENNTFQLNFCWHAAE